MNIANCGGRHNWTDEMRKKASEVRKGRKTPEIQYIPIKEEPKEENNDEGFKITIRKKPRDRFNSSGNYILTCSTELSEKKKKDVFHSGAGRIGK